MAPQMRESREDDKISVSGVPIRRSDEVDMMSGLGVCTTRDMGVDYSILNCQFRPCVFGQGSDASIVFANLGI